MRELTCQQKRSGSGHKADVFAILVSGIWNDSTEDYDPSCPASLHGGCSIKHENKFGKDSVSGQQTTPWLTICFWIAHELRMSFTFSIIENESKEEYLMIQENYIKFDFGVHKQSFIGTRHTHSMAYCLLAATLVPYNGRVE